VHGNILYVIFLNKLKTGKNVNLFEYGLMVKKKVGSG
jgi:hypothetical protein